MYRIRPKALAIVGIVSALGVLGAGFAVAATSGTTIKACAKRSDGALRLAKTCKSTEKAVRWGVTGPRGATGATGPVGPSDVRLFTAAATAAGTLQSGSNVATFTLPAGNWLLHADVRVGGTAADSAAFCTFNINSSVKGLTFTTSTVAPKAPSTFTSAVLPVGAAVALIQATPLNLYCRNSDGAASISTSPITATRVGTLTPAPAAQTFAP